jgi:hypothetical protein
MTQVNTIADASSNARIYLYKYLNPPSGSDNITVNFVASTAAVGGSTSYYNVDQTTPLENNNTSAGTSATSSSVIGNSSGTGRIAYSSIVIWKSGTPYPGLSDNASWTQRWSQTSQNACQGDGCTINIGSGNITASWTESKSSTYADTIAVITPVSTTTGHVEMDILVRQNDGTTVRATIATGVAASSNITTSEATYTATYGISAYTVVAQTDYLELDFYDNVTVAGGSTAYLKIDNNSLAATDQTRSDNWSFTHLPSQPQPQQPVNNSYTNDNTPTFQWIVGQNADNHRILVDNDGDLLSPVDNVLLGATDNTWTKPDPGYADGTYYWKIVAINAQDENSSGIWSFTIDTVPPSNPTLVSPASGANLNTTTPTLSWNSVSENSLPVLYYAAVSDNSSFPYENRSSGWISATSWVISPALTEGVWYWRVQAKYNAGNVGVNSSSHSFRVDVTAPSIPSLVWPTNGENINVTTPTLDWSDVADLSSPVTYGVQVDNDSDFSSPIVNVTGLAASVYTIPTLAEGRWYWRANAKDNAGNVGANSSSQSFRVDVTAPLAPSLVSPADGSNLNTTTPTLSWNSVSENSLPVLYYVAVSDNSSFPYENRNSGWISATSWVVSSALTEGVWYWRVQAKDNAGNVGANSPSQSFRVDMTAPSSPSLVWPAPGENINDNTPTLDWSDITDPSMPINYGLQVDNDSDFSSPVENITGLMTSAYTTSELAEGVWYWRANTTDNAGNTSGWSTSRSFRADVTSPSSPTLIEPTDGIATNDNTPTFKWNAVPDSSAPVTYYLQVDDDNNFSSPEINVSGLLENTYTPMSALVDENYSWRVSARDNAGNWGAWSSTWTLRVDTIVGTPVLLEPSNGAIINDNNPTFRWTIVGDNSTPVTYDLMVDNDSGFTSPEIVSGLSDNTYTPTSELSDENYSWMVRARDNVGNIGTWSSIWTFLLDTLPPEAPNLSTPADGTITDNNTPILLCSTVNDTSKSETGEVAGVKNYEFWVDNDSDFLSPEICENSTDNVYISAELNGENYSWRVRAWDCAGNFSSFSSIWTFVIENFSISTDPESLEILRGATGVVGLSIVEGYGPSENAALSGSWAGDTPDDVTASFAPAENKMPFESTLAFDIGASASPGTFTYRVKATSDSGMDRTVDVEVTIVSTIFTVDTYLKSLELMRSDTATSTVSVNYLLGKKDTVFLSGSWIGAAPVDVVTSLSPGNGLPPFSSTARFTAGKNATAGSFTYRVTGAGGGLTRTDVIIVKIITNLTLTLNTDNTSYEKGQKIRISGTAKDPKGNPVENGKATITLKSDNWTDQLVAQITDGTYAEYYYITFDKPDGDWTIFASAADDHGNLGQSTENVTVSVSIPEAWKYYTITFLSPVPGTVYSRGSKVTVTVQITDGAEKISGAGVSLAAPSGGVITLTERSPGIYSITYVLRWDDPVGEWTISVLGEKTVQGTYKAGSASTSLNILPADLQLESLEPVKRTFEIGDEVDVKVKVSYSDGSPVDGAIVVADSFNGENITLMNEGEGIYRGAYSVSGKDLGEWGLTVSAVDAYGNSGTSSEVTLSFKELSPSSYPIRYWWITILVAIACVLTPTPIVVKKLRVRKLKSIKSEIRATEKLRKELPERYFVKGAISRETYDSIMNQSLEKLMKLKKEVGKLQKMLEKKGLT